MIEPANEPTPVPTKLDAAAWLAVLAPVLCLLPVLNKAFHIDDPVYLWVAQHIQNHPLDYYGFTKNWSFFEEPMYQINQNPPGVSFFIAIAAFIVGWTEPALHAVFLLPVFALSLGAYRLAQMLTARPAIATLTAMLAPVTLVSSSNLMSDTLTLALSTWAVVLWLRGFQKKSPSDSRQGSREKFESEFGPRETSPFEGGFRGMFSSAQTYLSMTLLALAILTKYLAVCFVPLLIAYALLHRSSLRTWLPALIPVFAIVGAYILWSHRLYGINPLSGAASFAVGFDEPERSLPFGARFTTGLAFAGGCHIAALFFLPVLWRPRTALVLAALPAVALALLFAFRSDFAQTLMHPAFKPVPGFYPQLILFTIAGVHLIVLAADDIRRNRTPDAALLALWVLGFFVFSTFVNWTINGRTMLPIAPAFGILIARRLEIMERTSARKESPPLKGDLGGCCTSGRTSPLAVAIPLIPSTILALLVLWSDTQLANAGRAAAQNFAAQRESYPANVWIQGNWGPRWYFEAEGAKPFDSLEPSLQIGDVVVQSSNNLIYALPNELTQSLHTDAIPAGRFLATMDRRTGAGFYSSVWGPLPYAFGPIPDERYHYLRLAPR